MNKKLHLTVAKPCHENWDAMSPVEKGKFCGACQKQVVDFSRMSDRQIAEFFKKPTTGSVCGRFMSDQLDRSFEIPKKRIPWLRYFFQMALPALFLSRAAAQQPKTGKVAPAMRDTSKVQITDEFRTMGIVAPQIRPFENDTVKVQPITKTIKGKVTDQKGAPIAYASIQAGKTKSTYFADEKGEFDIRVALVNDKSSLLVSSAGFDSKEIAVENKTGWLSIQLTANADPAEIMISSAKTFIQGEISVKECNPIKNADTVYATDEIIQRDIPVPADKNKFYIYPNPVLAGGNLAVGVHMLEDGAYTCEYLSVSGQLIEQKEIVIDAETRLLNIEVPSVAAGSYLFVLINRKTGKKYSEKVVIQ